MKNPKMKGDDVLQCTASELEGKGVAIVVKKMNKKEYGLRMTDLTTDGDQKAQKFCETAVWKRGDGVPDDWMNKKVCPTPPKHHKGSLLFYLYCW